MWNVISKLRRLPCDYVFRSRRKELKMTDSQFAVYSADDKSLAFYRRQNSASEGKEFEGKIATRVFGDFKRLSWLAEDVADNVSSVVVADDGVKPKSISYWFSQFPNLVSADLVKLDTTETMAAKSLFEDCVSLREVKMPRYGLSRAADVSRMFYGCISLENLNMDDFDLYSAVDLHEMFCRCERLKRIGAASWNVMHAEDLTRMFYRCSSLVEDLRSWALEDWKRNIDFSTGGRGVIDPDWERPLETFLSGIFS